MIRTNDSKKIGIVKARLNIIGVAVKVIAGDVIVLLEKTLPIEDELWKIS
jgi:hypothetical protein